MNAIRLYLDCLFGAEPAGSFVELRWRLRDGGMAREFFAVRDPRLADLIEARGRTADIWIAVAPRAEQDGTRAAVKRCHVLYVDCDEPGSLAALEDFAPRPSMIVYSGRGRHAYWSLVAPVGPDELEAANRRLAYALGADMRATDAARILRPPGTLNHKRGEPVPVTLEASLEVYADAAAIVGDLPDPPDRRAREGRASGPVRPLTAVPDSLADIAPADYVRALTGREVGRDGKIACPLPGHRDATPSMHVYDDAEAGWYCFGCGRGGDIYTLAALLADYAVPLTGADFLRVRGVLLDHLAGEVAA